MANGASAARLARVSTKILDCGFNGLYMAKFRPFAFALMWLSEGSLLCIANTLIPIG